MPYLGYFQCVAAVDKYILYDNLPYQIGGWINRNRICLRNAPPYWVVVPIEHKSCHKLIKNTYIDNSKPWKQKFISLIRQSYANAHYFDEIFPLIENIMYHEYLTISELNKYSICKICDFLDIKTNIISDCSKYQSVEDGLNLIDIGDYSAFPYLKKTSPSKKVARPIAICKYEGAERYINAVGGTKLYEKLEFAQYDIQLNFIMMNEIRYSQHNNAGRFEPCLSIIDVMMNNGKEETKIMLNEYSIL